MGLINDFLRSWRRHPTWSVRWSVVGVVLLGLCLRVWGIRFGLPYLYHPDEPEILGIALRIFKTGDLNPHFFLKPSLPIYLNALAYVPYYLIGKLQGVFQVPADIPGPILLAMGVGHAPMPSTVLLGRLLTAITGSAAIVLVFVIGRRLADNHAVGLLAALMMAISPTNVAHSRYVTHDTFVIFFLLLSFWGSLQLLLEGKTWQYAAAGIAGGLAASAKYNGSLILLSLVSAHFLRNGLKGWKDHRLYLALGSSTVAFLMTTPFAVLDHERFLADLRRQAYIYSTGHAGMEGEAFKWYGRHLWNVEGPISLLAAIGIARGIYRWSQRTVLLSLFPLIYFAFIIQFVVRNDRTLLPLIPFLFLLASQVLVDLFKRAAAWRSGLRRPLIFALVGLTSVALMLPLIRTARNTLRLITVDSRETGRIWIDDNLPEGAKIAIEPYAPYVDPKRFSVQGVGKMIEHDPGWYAAQGFGYLVFSQGMFGRFYSGRYPRQAARYDALFRAFEMVRTFKDGGFEIRIYRVTNR